MCRGTRIKTRKRNIAAPLDPAAFSDAVVLIYLDNAGDLVSLFISFSVSYLHPILYLCFFRNLLPRPLSHLILISLDTAIFSLR